MASAGHGTNGSSSINNKIVRPDSGEYLEAHAQSDLKGCSWQPADKQQ